MDTWIPITILAAVAQTARFGLQKQLKATRLSTAGTTFARFVYSAPLVALIMLGYGTASTQAIPAIPTHFWAYALTGGTAQILATMCVVALFAHRNFAVGISFKKTEVIMSVIVGMIVLREGVSWTGFAAILLGLLGVLLLSDPPAATGPWHRRIFNRAAGLGVLSGLLFAISAVGYRGAALSLSHGDALLRALTTLACVTAFQTLAMAAYMAWRERGEIGRVFAVWRVGLLVGISSMIGSICWFTAFALQTVAYVKALGQVELIFSFLVSALIFKEKTTAREYQGVVVLCVAIIALIVFI
jgi:drug/metabolite transporter (DMT)-like permease